MTADGHEFRLLGQIRTPRDVSIPGAPICHSVHAGRDPLCELLLVILSIAPRMHGTWQGMQTCQNLVQQRVYAHLSKQTRDGESWRCYLGT